MFEDLARRINRNERRLDDLVVPEISADLVSPLLSLPVLRGAWIASVDASGNWDDSSGHAHHLTLNGNPEFNYDGLVPYFDYDGTGDFHDRADEPDNSITGTETSVASAVRGLTAGGWLWADTLQDWDHWFSKTDSTGVNQRAWRLMQSTVANARMWFSVSTDGINWVSVQTDTGLLTTGAWHCCFGRFVPSTSLDIFFDGEWWSNTTSIPASVFNSTAPLVVGSWGAGAFNLWDGRASDLGLCAAACSDAQISSYFNQTRSAFGV